jgi:hypothetical protein
MTHLGMSYTEIRKLPVTYRRWYIDKIIRDLKQKSEAQRNAMSKDKVQEVPMGEMVQQMESASQFSSPKKF